jgi:hypothetical protein
LQGLLRQFSKVIHKKIYEKTVLLIYFKVWALKIIEQKNREKVIHSQFILPCSNPETQQFGRTQVVQINI